MNLPLWLWRLLWPIRAKWHAGLEVGELFPEFRLDDLQGHSHAVPERSGRAWTLLWFTNLCEDCRARIPLLEELREAAGGRLRILAVSLLGEDQTLPRQVSSSCGFPILLDPRDIVAHELGLEHPPQTCPLKNLFILDPDGRIALRHHLSALKPDEFRALWRACLREGGLRRE